MSQDRLDRVVKALCGQRAQMEQHLAEAEAERARLDRELDQIDARLQAAQRACLSAEDLHLRRVADRAVGRLHGVAEQARQGVLEVQSRRVEPARTAAIEARVRLRTVELLKERRRSAAQADLRKREERTTEEVAARSWFHSARSPL